MEVIETSLQDAFVLRYPVHRDERGFFVRIMDRIALLQGTGFDPSTIEQESQSRSRRSVLRGLHGRKHLSEAKLVRCAHGAIYDVIVDLRPWSATFKRWQGFHLDDVEHLQLFVPPGFAHGFQVLSEEADIHYRMDAVYEPSLDYAVRFNDPEFQIDWPLQQPILSPRDIDAQPFSEIEGELSEWYRRPGA